jgi:hypothetical protein
VDVKWRIGALLVICSCAEQTVQIGLTSITPRISVWKRLHYGYSLLVLGNIVVVEEMGWPSYRKGNEGSGNWKSIIATFD